MNQLINARIFQLTAWWLSFPVVSEMPFDSYQAIVGNEIALCEQAMDRNLSAAESAELIEGIKNLRDYVNS